MIFTPDILTNQTSQLAGLALVLRPVPPSSSAIALSEWLHDETHRPFWVPLTPRQGLIKVMPVLPDLKSYPVLFQSICQRLIQANVIEWQKRHYEITGVETQTDSLFVIQFSLSHQKSLPATLSRAIHSLCFQWFTNANPGIAEQLHQASISPFSISTKPKNRQQLQVRIAVLQPELLSLLLWGLCPDLGQEIFLTDITCQVSSQVQIIASSRYEKLAQIAPLDSLELEFLTPTSFKQDDIIIQPFPLPELVFAGLLRRWNAFAPDELKFDLVSWAGVVAAFDLETRALKMGHNEIGSKGWVRYRFLDSRQAAISTILAHFAYFSGVGRKTTMGMGQTQLLQRK